MDTKQTSPAADDAACPDWSFDRAAIIGAGAMGTALAAMLGSVLPTTLVCRSPDRAAELFRHGAVCTGAIERRSSPLLVRSVAELAGAGGAAAVFVATKTTAIPQVADELAAHLDAVRAQRSRLFVVSFQNGIEPGRLLMERLGHGDVLRMVLTIGAVMDETAGAVRITMDRPPHAIGSPNPAHRGCCEVLAETLTRGGLGTRYEPHIERAVWEKAVVNAAVNPVAALCNCSVGEVLDSPAAAIFRRLLSEGVAVARADGISLPADFETRAEALVQKARGHVPSMVEDIRSGRESEVGQLNRQIIEHGRRNATPTPTHETVDALIETFDWKVYRRRAGAQG